MRDIFAVGSISRTNLIEIGVWIAAYWFILAMPMALGASNGIGYFQQPQGHSLWLPLLFGGFANIWIIYLHAFRAMPRLMTPGARWGYLTAALIIIIAYLTAHLIVQLTIAVVFEPSLRKLGMVEWTVENLRALPVVLVLSVIYRFGRDWVLNINVQHELHELRTRHEAEYRNLKTQIDQINQSPEKPVFLHFESGREKFQTPASAIHYLKAAGNYVEIISNEKTFTTYGSIRDIGARLPQENFVRVHRSYIVNLELVSRISNQHVAIGDCELPIGGTYKRALNEKWASRA